ncbi:hypothetical protein OHC33_005518 [Knufia fluminis]|uniref:Uncharacterized protein n=1 Tax=Knufia fluminis TaxID=191047 RepID=A0AAN8EE79_9EURO|nr:hypothetical protein OHC33_005518 [Knufia fluminis]
MIRSSGKLAFACFLCLLVLIIYRHDALDSLLRRPIIPVIPQLVWQVFLDAGGPPGDLKAARESWSILNPDHELILVDQSGVSAQLDQYLKTRPHLQHVLNASVPFVLRAAILRYLLLASYGGVYSDIDVTALQPTSTWIPHEFKSAARLVVGIEYDQLDWDERWPRTIHSVQLCQWTIMVVPDHKVLWTVTERAAYALVDLADKQGTDLSNLDLSDNQIVMSTTGPVVWTAVILEYLRKHFRADLQYRDLSNVTEPTLFHDVLILPINAFGTGQEHSGSVRDGSPDALVRHAWRGSWLVKDHS